MERSRSAVAGGSPQFFHAAGSTGYELAAPAAAPPATAAAAGEAESGSPTAAAAAAAAAAPGGAEAPARSVAISWAPVAEAETPPAEAASAASEAELSSSRAAEAAEDAEAPAPEPPRARFVTAAPAVEAPARGGVTGCVPRARFVLGTEPAGAGDALPGDALPAGLASAIVETRQTVTRGIGRVARGTRSVAACATAG